MSQALLKLDPQQQETEIGANTDRAIETETDSPTSSDSWLQGRCISMSSRFWLSSAYGYARTPGNQTSDADDIRWSEQHKETLDSDYRLTRQGRRCLSVFFTTSLVSLGLAACGLIVFSGRGIALPRKTQASTKMEPRLYARVPGDVSHFALVYTDEWCNFATRFDTCDASGCNKAGFDTPTACENICSADAQCHFFLWGTSLNGFKRCTTFGNCHRRSLYLGGDPSAHASIYRKVFMPVSSTITTTAAATITTYIPFLMPFSAAATTTTTTYIPQEVTSHEAPHEDISLLPLGSGRRCSRNVTDGWLGVGRKTVAECAESVLNEALENCSHELFLYADNTASANRDCGCVRPEDVISCKAGLRYANPDVRIYLIRKGQQTPSPPPVIHHADPRSQSTLTTSRTRTRATTETTLTTRMATPMSTTKATHAMLNTSAWPTSATSQTTMTTHMITSTSTTKATHAMLITSTSSTSATTQTIVTTHTATSTSTTKTTHAVLTTHRDWTMYTIAPTQTTTTTPLSKDDALRIDVADAVQGGASHIAEAAQGGASHIAEAAQGGASHIAEAAQGGASHLAEAAQGGASHLAEAAHGGASHLAEAAHGGAVGVEGEAAQGWALMSHIAGYIHNSSSCFFLGCVQPGLASTTQIAALTTQTVLTTQPVLTTQSTEPTPDPARCAGTLRMNGFQEVHLIRAGMNAPGDEVGKVDVLPTGTLVFHMKARTYFGTSCDPSTSYHPQEYASMKLLGKTLSFTVDLSGAECGTNVAFYLTSLSRNTRIGTCGGDYYCDANKVCGIDCAEIDIMEANKHVFVTTLHTHDDPGGEGDGINVGHSAWSRDLYGPGGKCIDTNRPFVVKAFFPLSPKGVSAVSAGLTVALSQSGHDAFCPEGLSMSTGATYRGLAELTEQLKLGMTPIISYWGAGENLGWFDGTPVETPSTPSSSTGVASLTDNASSLFCSAPGNYADTVRMSDFSLQ